MTRGDDQRTDEPNSLNYRQSGVDIEAGEALVEKIKPAAKSTSRPGVIGGLGGFGALFDLKAAGYVDPILVSTTDGVGTKLKVAIEAGRHTTVGIDLVAMCVNDLVVQGAEPLFFLDYFATGRLSIDSAREIVAGIADGCRQAGCALVGGETAEMPGMYAEGDYDLAGFAVGAVDRSRLLPSGVQEGQTLLGLGSSGLHSNGYSLVRRVLSATHSDLSDAAPFDTSTSLADALLVPTRIYVHPVLALHRAGLLSAAAHITGGGLPGNLNRILPDGLDAIIDSGWRVPPVMAWLAGAGGISTDEMLRVFNCGIGMVLAVPDAESAIEVLTQAGEQVFKIGHIGRGAGKPAVRFDLPRGWLT